MNTPLLNACRTARRAAQACAAALALPTAAVLPAAPAALALLAGMAPAQQPAEVIQKVRFDQQLDAQVPLELVFRDSTGASVHLGDLLRERTTILTLVYYECPMMCTQVLNELVRSLRPLGLRVGQDFDVVTVSINPRETPAMAAEKKRRYIEAIGQPEAQAGWHFLVGDEPQIERLASTVGFHYFYDTTIKEYAHPAGIVLLTPGGRTSKYFFNLDWPARDLKFALIEASAGSIGSWTDRATLWICYHYDPKTGKYGFAIISVIRLLGILTVGLLVGYMILMLRRERRTAQSRASH